MRPTGQFNRTLFIVTIFLLTMLVPAAINAANAPALAGPIYLPLISNGSAMPSQVWLTPVAPGLDGITDVTHAGDDRLFIAQQSGVIRVLQNGALLGAPFLDIADRVACCGERGLLGLAFHPGYAANGHFYVNYTTTAGGSSLRTRVSRFTASPPASNTADPGSEVVILEFEQPYTNHNGGALHFGPDGMLYIASGDGGSGYDPEENAQNTGSLLGKILRIDVNGTGGAGPDCSIAPGGGYRIPTGNPFSDGKGGGCDEVWAYGLRNPWRMSFDRQTGDLWIADVGQGEREEVDFQAEGSPGGANYGWDCWEGTLQNTGSDPAPACASSPSVVAPVHEYDHSGGGCSITGGYVYRGSASPGLRGLYFFADFCTGQLWALRGTGPRPAVTELLVNGATLATPRTFGEDAAGELYVASGTTVYRIGQAGPQ